MTNDELAFTPVHALAAEMAAGRLTSTKLTEACLGRIKAHGEKLHAFVAVYGDEALRAAHAADEAIASGHRVGPFHGIPVALKDIIDMKGRVTTGGSKVWEKRVSTRTATLAKKLISAGMIVLGKTHSVEFAMGSFGTNTHMGTPWNGPTRWPEAIASSAACAARKASWA